MPHYSVFPVIDKLVTVKIEKENVFLLHFHQHPDIFPFQKLAFTSPSVYTRYTWAVATVILRTLPKDAIPMELENAHHFLVERSFQRYNIGASHPTTGRCTLKSVLTKSKRIKLFMTYEFFNSEGYLIAGATGINLIFHKKSKASILLKKKRNTIQKKKKKNSGTFPFAAPLLVGCTSVDSVFISNPTSIANGVSVRCLVDISRGLERHAHMTGSGDHVNVNHYELVFQQIATAMTRLNPFLLPRFSSSSSLITTSCTFQMKKVVELNIEFKVKFTIIEKTKIKKLYGGMITSGVLFEVELRQNNELCVVGMIEYAPLFLARI